MPSPWARALWSSLYEPRSITALTILGYAVSIAAGLSLWIAPPGADDEAIALRCFITLGLCGGGLVGVPTAWRGWWWLERGAAGMVAAGMALAGVTAAILQPPHSGDPMLLSMFGFTLGTLAMVVRYLRVRKAPFAPGRGPESTRQRSARIRALLEDDAARHKRG